MTLGKVVKFDEIRGFGFIAPVGGREDVFLHVNDLLSREALVRPGAMVEFDIDEGERGLKASNVELLENDPEPAVPTRVAPATMARMAVTVPVDGSSLAMATTAGSSAAAECNGEEFCDSLTRGELSSQVTELLLAAIPPLTGEQILAIRKRLAEFAKDHGWFAPGQL